MRISDWSSDVCSSDLKITGVAHWGATIRLHGDSFDDARRFATELAAQHGYRLLSAFDDPDVIAGQGTVGLELAALAPDVALVPIGGGGLAAGVALALKSQGVRIVGAQVEGVRSEEHTSELQSLMRISYAVFCLTKKKKKRKQKR